MKKIISLALLMFVAVYTLISCGSENTFITDNNTDTKAENEIETNKEDGTMKDPGNSEEVVVYTDSIFGLTDSIEFSSAARRYSIIITLKDYIDLAEKHGFGCAVLKIVPKNYEFYLKKSSSDSELVVSGSAKVTVDIVEVVKNICGADFETSENAEICQDIAITPGDAFMDDFIKEHGTAGGDILSVEDGEYKLDKEKLALYGVKSIKSTDNPVLEYNKTYYVFVMVFQDDGVKTAVPYGYCDENLNYVVSSTPVKRTDFYGGHHTELAKMVKEYTNE